MKELSPQSSFISSFEAIEPNVVIAGLEGAAVAWIAYAKITGIDLAPVFPDDGWRWWYAVYTIFGVLGIFVLGLVVEGLADLLEYGIKRKLWGVQRGQWRGWYNKFTKPPSGWGRAQRWIWKSPQASHEFARRRLRILVARNTAFCLLVLTISIAVAICLQRPHLWFGVLIIEIAAGSCVTMLFVWIWLRAQHGWNKAIRDAGEIKAP